MYLICIVMAGAVTNSCDVTTTFKFHRTYFTGPLIVCELNDLLGCAVIWLMTLLYNKRRHRLFHWMYRYGMPFMTFLSTIMWLLCNPRKKQLFSLVGKYTITWRHCSTTQRVSNFFSIWTTLLSLVLIVICNPSMVNPGPNTGNDITVLYQNIRGFVPFSGLSKKVMPLNIDKLIEFQSKVYNDKPDVVILNETWLSSEHLDQEIFPNDSYTVYRADRSKRTHPPDRNNPTKFKVKGGGVLIAVRSCLDVEHERVKISTKAEILSVSLGSSNGSKYCITTCYRVGTLGSENFLEIEKHLKNIASRKKINEHIVIGDFNLPSISWSDGYSAVESDRQFLDLFNDLGFNQLIDQPTHNKGKTLDLLLSNTVGAVNNICVHDENDICSSDHYGITFSIKRKVRSKPVKMKMLNYKKANWLELNNDLKHVNWDQHLKYCDAETGWLRFTGILKYHINRWIPTITVEMKDKPPWCDSDSHNLFLKKKRLKKRSNLTGLNRDYIKFSKCRTELKELAITKMRANLEDDDDPALITKKFWSHVKSTSKSSRIPQTVNYKGRFRNNKSDQCEIFNEYFEDQFSEASNYDIEIDYSNDSENDIEFSTSRIRKILKNINVNKAPGPDGIHGKVLKNCRESLAYPLSLLFTTSYNIGQIPLEWKMANIVPVHKKGPKTSVENYRPISLTCLIMKVFERVISDELLAKCHDKLNGGQHGFLPHRSCTTQMLYFNDSLTLALNDNVRTDTIYFDFAKAFDTVNHDIILRKLKEQFNVDGTLLKFIMNYLCNRKQCVVIGGVKSSIRNVSSGVPQGSILGPLFFVLFINDMFSCVSEGTNIMLYADDTKIWRRIALWEDHLILQHDINMLHEWSMLNKMTFHPLKCKVLSIDANSRSENLWSTLPFTVFFYYLNNNELEYTKSEKDLGVIVNDRLNWDEHLLALLLKVSSRLGLMKRTLHFVKDKKRKRVLYLVLVRSLFEHCCEIWRPTTTIMLSKAESLQKRAVKWILDEQGHHYNDFEYMKRLKDLDILPLEYKFAYTDLVQFFKIYHDMSVVKLPEYLQPVTNDDTDRLRSNIRPPAQYGQAEEAGIPDFATMRRNRNDSTSLKCVIINQTATLKRSFFFRTHLMWNDLPTDLRNANDFKEFKVALKSHLWDIVLDPD